MAKKKSPWQSTNTADLYTAVYGPQGYAAGGSGGYVEIKEVDAQSVQGLASRQETAYTYYAGNYATQGISHSSNGWQWIDIVNPTSPRYYEQAIERNWKHIHQLEKALRDEVEQLRKNKEMLAVLQQQQHEQRRK